MAIHQSQQNHPGVIECLIGFAATAVKDGQYTAGVRLLAAAEAISGQLSASKWKANRMEFERYLALAREGLTKASFQAEQNTGRSLSLEQAVEYARQLQVRSVPEPGAKVKLGDLTAREREIAALIAQGKTNSQIAQELVLSKRTVEKHATNILSKLGLTSRTQIVRWAIEKGLVQASQ
jgi:DNA-binding CsgD family transcriptional regulator